jgi:outer membrane protein OmpA-like peptidoglycan-associated protein
MSFDLNKSGRGSSKFNLEKTEAPSAISDSKKNKSKTGWIILGLILVGAISLWILLDKNSTKENSAAVPVAEVESNNKKSNDAKAVESAVDTSNGGKPSKVNPAVFQNSVPGNFETGSSVVQPDAAIVRDLIAALSADPSQKIVVIGYASSEGDLAANQKLSKDRANSFKDYLVAKGIQADRIMVEAKGIEDPIASNDSEEGRRRNRRVQVTLSK